MTLDDVQSLFFCKIAEKQQKVQNCIGGKNFFPIFGQWNGTVALQQVLDQIYLLR